MNGLPRVLLIDDSAAAIKTIVKVFEREGFDITACGEPAEVLGWYSPEKFDYDLILLDFQLSTEPDGFPVNAIDVLPHLKTYAPGAKVAVVTVVDHTVEAAVKCIQLGAMAIFPKTSAKELSGLARVYAHLGDPLNTRQELVEVLWGDLGSGAGDRNGQRLEMLVINLFESMPTFRVIANNLKTTTGSIDVLVENQNKHDFWQGLGSLQLAIECKNHARPLEPQDFNQLAAVVRSRPDCQAGILVSMSPFPRSFRQHQGEVHQTEGIRIFGVEAKHLERLVEKSYDEREQYLRAVLEIQ